MVASLNLFPNISEEEVDTVINDTIPEKTKAGTKYGVRIFNGMWE